LFYNVWNQPDELQIQFTCLNLSLHGPLFVYSK
jgi:hypothetical protein